MGGLIYFWDRIIWNATNKKIFQLDSFVDFFNFMA